MNFPFFALNLFYYLEHSAFFLLVFENINFHVCDLPGFIIEGYFSCLDGSSLPKQTINFILN